MRPFKRNPAQAVGRVIYPRAQFGYPVGRLAGHDLVSVPFTAVSVNRLREQIEGVHVPPQTLAALGSPDIASTSEVERHGEADGERGRRIPRCAAHRRRRDAAGRRFTPCGSVVVRVRGFTKQGIRYGLLLLKQYTVMYNRIP